jgi:membrane protease YdiL (CAAX protease family)
MHRFRRALIFYTLALGISWGYWVPLILSGQRVEPGSPTSHLPGLMGPALAAAAVVIILGRKDEARRFFGACVRIPANPCLVAAATVAPPVLSGAALVAMNGAGPFPPPSDFLAYPGVAPGLASPLALTIILFLNGFGEEAGWRGFLQGELERLGSRFAATLTVALAWAFWHLPLFWLNMSMQGLVGPMVLGWLLSLVLGSFFMAWLWHKSGGSVPALAVWHVAYSFSVATPATVGIPAAVVSSAVLVAGLLIAGRWWVRRRDRPA